jgi:hypothetical protein
MSTNHSNAEISKNSGHFISDLCVLFIGPDEFNLTDYISSARDHASVKNGYFHLRGTYYGSCTRIGEVGTVFNMIRNHFQTPSILSLPLPHEENWVPQASTTSSLPSSLPPLSSSSSSLLKPSPYYNVRGKHFRVVRNGDIILDTFVPGEMFLNADDFNPVVLPNGFQIFVHDLHRFDGYPHEISGIKFPI